jgi:hypothetical protein
LVAQIIKGYDHIIPLATIARGPNRKVQSARRPINREPKERWDRKAAGIHAHSDQQVQTTKKKKRGKSR